jgi:CCR4-NOT transcription complex subunit 2
MASQSSFPDGPAQTGDSSRNPLGAIGNDAPTIKPKEDKENRAPEVQDPLAGMAPIDKFGLKGLRMLMNNYPDYNALVVGLDPSSLGLDLSSTEYG